MRRTPTPPHQYVFTVYALNTNLDLSPAATKAELVIAMEGHILAQGETVGKYTAGVETKVFGTEN